MKMSMEEIKATMIEGLKELSDEDAAQQLEAQANGVLAQCGPNDYDAQLGALIWLDAAKRIREASAQASKFAEAIRKHRDQKGDDRCWLDDHALYAVLPEGIGRADLRVLPPEEMLEQCKKFIACRGAPLQEYVSPQREIDRLTAGRDALMVRLAHLCQLAEKDPTQALAPALAFVDRCAAIDEKS